MVVDLSSHVTSEQHGRDHPDTHTDLQASPSVISSVLQPFCQYAARTGGKDDDGADISRVL